MFTKFELNHFGMCIFEVSSIKAWKKVFLKHFRPMEFSIKLHTIKSGRCIVYLGFSGNSFKIKLFFVLANSTDPDYVVFMMRHFIMGLCCLQNYPFKGFIYCKDQESIQ